MKFTQPKAPTQSAFNFKTNMCNRLSSKATDGMRKLVTRKGYHDHPPIYTQICYNHPICDLYFLSLNLVNVLWRKNAKADLFFIPLQHHLRLFLTTSFWMTDTAPEMWYPDCVCHIVLSSPCCREPNQSSTWIARIKIKTGPTVSWRSWFLVV